jgi:hypothetical protein
MSVPTELATLPGSLPENRQTIETVGARPSEQDVESPMLLAVGDARQRRQAHFLGPLLALESGAQTEYLRRNDELAALPLTAAMQIGADR